MSVIEIIPTVVPSSLADIEAVADRVSSFAHTLHIDIADGTFAPNTTWMPHGEQFTTRPGLLYEVHLMVALPKEIGLACIAAGARRVIGHIEAMQENTPEIFDAWKRAGAAEVGAGLLFPTPLDVLDPYVDSCDVVQMMAIKEIGVQGLPFAPEAPARVAQLHQRHPKLLLSVDGSVNETTIGDLARAGAQRFCAGSVLSKSPNPLATYTSLIAHAESALQ